MLKLHLCFRKQKIIKPKKKKVKSSQLVVYSPLKFSEAVTKFFPSIHSVYLPENKNIVKREDISKARKIVQTLKMYKLEKNVVRMIILTSIFSKFPMMKIFLTYNQTDDECTKYQGTYNEGEEWLCCPVCHQ